MVITGLTKACVTRLDSRTERYNRQSLEAGCHVGTAEPGDVVRVDGAREVVLEAPVTGEVCG